MESARPSSLSFAVQAFTSDGLTLFSGRCPILHLASGKTTDELVSADTADCAAAIAEHFAQLL
ncbi:hypothetical protein ARTHRO8AJ_300035 [Arthrobacter sp. 8AJ]|nr:hypothetical protein ARTHRO8AJ_300035 [Arthrobacter sp. 8AJ]